MEAAREGREGPVAVDWTAAVAEAPDRGAGSSGTPRRILLALFGYAALLGVLLYFLPEEESPMDLLLGVPLLVLSIAWCYADAAERGFRIGGPTRALLVGLFAIGFPLYVFQSRGAGGIR